MSRPHNSTFYFIGKLYPEEWCHRFHPGEIQIEKGWILDVFHNGISIWNSKVSSKFDAVGTYAKDALEIIVSSFNFLTNSRLKCKIDNWVEAKKVKSISNIIGWYLPRTPKRESLKPNNKLNIAWRKAGKFYPKIRKSFYHKLALRDYQNCLDSGTDDAFFYAFRIIEDIRHATTQHLPSGLAKQQYWDEMHNLLGTSELQLKPLTDASTKVRHGEFDDPILRAARRDREQIIKIAFDVMRKEFKRYFRGFCR